MDATAYTAGAATDKDCVTWVTAFQDDLVATKERCHRVCAQHLALIEVNYGVEGQRAGNASNRVKFH